MVERAAAEGKPLQVTNGSRSWLSFAAAFVSALLVFIVSALAQPGPLSDREAFDLSIERSGDLTIFHWAIAPDHYLYRDTIGVRDAEGASVPVATSAGWPHEDESFGAVEVFFSETTASVDTEDLGDGPFTVTYRGCLEGSLCYPEVVRAFDVATLTEVASGSDRENVSTAGEADSGGIVVERPAGIVSSLIDQGGVAWTLVGFVFFGVALAFTPCVFPMYPIIAAAVVGPGVSSGLPRRGMLAVAYVLSMSTAFALLGVGAAFFGQTVQVFLRSPVAILLSALVFVGLAMSMFGVVRFGLPSSWLSRFGLSGAKGSFSSAAVLGFTSALVVGPCVTAPLAGALLYVAHTGDVLIGASALFALGIGKGIPLTLFAVLGSSVFPRSGPWLEISSKTFGFVLLASAIQIASGILPGPVVLMLWSTILVFASVALGVFDRAGDGVSLMGSFGKAIGVLAVIQAVILAIGASAGASDPLRPLAPFLPVANDQEDVFREARTPAELSALVQSSPRGTVLYFTADWCVTCRALERDVFSDQAVGDFLRGAGAIKVDLTTIDEAKGVIMQELDVVGPPTMIFLDSVGVETSSSRLVGTIEKDTILGSVRTIQGD